MSFNASPIIQSGRCTNCCRGTWPGFVLGWISATLPEPRRSPDAYADPGHVVGPVLAADSPIFGQSLIDILDSADWSDCYRASGSGRN